MKKVFWLAAVAAVMLAPRSGVGGFIEKSRFFGRMGERVEVPENTLRAYRFAIDNGFPVELPVCPVCGFVYVPEELALGKVASVERALEVK